MTAVGDSGRGEAALIDAYDTRFDKIMPGPIPGSAEILVELRRRGPPLYGLTNFSPETYPPSFARFEFCAGCAGSLCRARSASSKPDPRIYEIAIECFAMDPQCAADIDVVPIKVTAAVPFGIHAIHFTSAASLRGELASLGLRRARGDISGRSAACSPTTAPGCDASVKRHPLSGFLDARDLSAARFLSSARGRHRHCRIDR